MRRGIINITFIVVVIIFFVYKWDLFNMTLNRANIDSIFARRNERIRRFSLNFFFQFAGRREETCRNLVLQESAVSAAL